MRFTVMLFALTLAVSTAGAQVSASFRQTEHVINAGGTPALASALTSPSFKIRLSAIGDNALGTSLTSASFHADAGFVDAYPPPGEVRSMSWSSKTAMSWTPEKSVGSYNLYRDLLTNVSGAGTCSQASLPANSAGDPSIPSAGTGFFYLVTAKNRLREEGTKGNRSNGTPRPNSSPCP